MRNSLFVLILILGLGAKAQSVTEAYIEKWYKTAIAEMQEYGIPASITMAQAILESGSGQSYLAKKGKNHFGIKCHSDWKGKKVYYDDDAKDECFRSYKKDEQSFRDHSIFLSTRSRYAFLFEEKPDDYKAWAKGLKKAGYATDPNYPKRLMDLIERYDLDQYDEFTKPSKETEEEKPMDENAIAILASNNKVKYVIAGEEDTFESIALATYRKPEDLLKYNELRYDAQLLPGQRLYIQPKRNKAARGKYFHLVEEGESMYSIAQLYAVKLNKLYAKNGMVVGEKVKVGQKLELR